MPFTKLGCQEKGQNATAHLKQGHGDMLMDREVPLLRAGGKGWQEVRLGLGRHQLRLAAHALE